MINSRRLTLIVGLAWGSIVLTGFAWLVDYDATPGSAHSPPQGLPCSRLISANSDCATLVLAAHPKCSCTRASIAELAYVMSRCQGQVAAHVLFYRPKEFAGAWAETDLWRHAATIPGVQTHCDEDGIEAGRLGAVTSGEVILYDKSGRLVFHGGITGSRGHVGANIGRDAVISLITQGTAEQTETPVYGCPLCSPRQSGR